MRRTLPRTLLTALTAALAAALLAGCFSIENAIEVNEDGSGVQRVRFTMPMELFGMVGEEAPSADEMRAEFENEPDIQELRAALQAHGGSLELIITGEAFGFEMTIAVPASDDFAAALRERHSSLPSPEELPLGSVAAESMVLRHDGDRWVYEEVIPDLAATALGEMELDASDAEFASLFLDGISLTQRLRLPGTLIEHNADEVLPDGTLVWHIGGTDGERSLTATSDVGGGGLNMPLVAGLVVVLLVAAGLGWLAMSRRRVTPPAAPPPEAPAA